MFEFIYASSYRVSVPCMKFRPLISDIEITRLLEDKTRYRDSFPVLSPLLLGAARSLVQTLGGDKSKDVGVRQVSSQPVQSLSIEHN